MGYDVKNGLPIDWLLNWLVISRKQTRKKRHLRVIFASYLCLFFF